MKVKSVADVYCSYLYDIERLKKENKKLQERLADADKTLRFYDSKDFHYEVDGVVMGAEPAHKYFIKWNVLANNADENRLVSNADESAMCKNCTIELTKQQKFVLYLLANKGMSNADIARELKVKEQTVKMHIKELFKKTGTNSRLSLVVWYYKTVDAIRSWQNVKMVEWKGKVK